MVRKREAAASCGFPAARLGAVRCAQGNDLLSQGALRVCHTPSSHRICCPYRIITPLGAAHCAHAQGQSRVRACRTVREEHAAPAAWEMQTETPPKQAALARQVRQRMNRLGKPEHRARFCFFSKKKSLAGTRRFPITPEIQIRMDFNRSALNPRNPKNPFSTAVLRRCLHHHIRKNHRHITPRHPRPPAGACANHIPSSHRICRPLRAIAPLGAAHCAHAQGQSRVRACRTVREAYAAPAA